MDFFGFISSAPRTKCANRGFTKECCTALMNFYFLYSIFYSKRVCQTLNASSINVDEVHEEKTVLMFLTVEEVNFYVGKYEWQ